MTQQLKRLDQLFAFKANTPIFPILEAFVKAVELRFQSVEVVRADYEATISQLTALALQRMNEVFTPLILDAQARLQEFGANFAAHSVSSLTLGTGPKALSIDEADRPGFVFSDYVAVRRHGHPEQNMLCRTDGYDRETGTFLVTAESFEGTGTFDDWDITLSVAPDLSHAARTDNPHQVTAAQVGSYTSGQVDSLITAWADDLLEEIQPANFLTKAGNLSGLASYPTAWINLGLKTAAAKDIGTTGDKVPVLNVSNLWDKPQGTPVRTITNGAGIDLTTGQVWTASINGSTFTIANPGTPPPYNNQMFVVVASFVTSDNLLFGGKFKVAGYLPSAAAGTKDVLSFLWDQGADAYYLVGVRNGVNL